MVTGIAEVPKPKLRDKIKPVTETSLFVKTLIYGDYGAGKTVFAAGAPNPLFIDTEKGTLSLLKHPELRKTHVLQIENWEELDDLMWEIKGGEYDQFETVVIDSISELQKRKLDEQLKDAAKKDRNRNPYLPYQQDYLINTEILRRLVIFLRDLNKNLVIIAHQVEEKDQSDGHLYYRPALTPKLAQTTVGIMDVVGYFDSVEDSKTGEVTKRTLRVQKTRTYTAKNRLMLPAIIENPTFQMLLDAKAEVIERTETNG